MWVRGLKLTKNLLKNNRRLSHPMWVRGLKHKNGLSVMPRA